MSKADYRPSKPPLVVAALAPVLRWPPGRNPGAKDDTTRHLSGRSVRVLAFGLAFVISASQMTARERAAGNVLRKSQSLLKSKHETFSDD
jgi:hypothetical protein